MFSEASRTVGGVIAVTTFLTFLLSTTYEYFFFYVISGDYFKLFTVNDLIQASLVWLPITFASCLLGAGVNLFFSRVERFQTEEQLAGDSRSIAKFRASGRWVESWGIPIIVGISAFSLPLNIALFNIGFFFAMMWYIFANWFFSDQNAPGKENKLIRMIVYFLPPMIIISGFYGASNSINETRDKINLVSINGKGESEKIIRSLERGMIIYNINDNSIRFTPWQNIESIHKQYAVDNNESIFCRFLEIMCPSPEAKKATEGK